MSYFVKVIPPSGRARIHKGDCRYCRNGQGMENQHIGTGPTFWHPEYPAEGFLNLESAQSYMAGLSDRYKDKGLCSYCMKA